MIRSVLLAASRSAWLEHQFRTRRFARRAVRRFMPGESLDEAIAAARQQQELGAGVLLTFLGENVRSRAEALAASRQYREALARYRSEGLAGPPGPRAEVSVKPTHLGLDLGVDVATRSLQEILEAAGAAPGQVWVDMESSSYVDRTLAIYFEMLPRHPGLGLCLQAYLRRTPADLDRVLAAGGSVRLVKGAYREPPDVAYSAKRDVDRAYLEMGRTLRDHPPGDGRRHVLGTHDPAMIDGVLDTRATRGDRASLEVQMLYGIAVGLQRDLLRRGVPLGVLISYGAEWFPWYMRRLAERPANVGFVVRSVFRG